MVGKSLRTPYFYIVLSSAKSILVLVEELPKANTGTYNSLEAPKIQINEVFSPGMGLNGFSGFLTDPDTPTKQTSELLQNHHES